jgi:hypothetical protein
MRFDLPQDVPHEVPRSRQPESPAIPPLKPSPIESRRDSLNEQAEHPHQVSIPRAEHRNRIRLAVTDARSQSIPHDQRLQRDRIPPQAIGLSLRAEEIKLLAEVGRFRVIATSDLAETVYGNRPSRLERDLAFLKQRGLVQVDTVQARRDGRRGRSERIEVVTLTRAGKEMAQQTSGLPEEQRFYAGLVKPREVEHDAQIYRAYRKEAERIGGTGGTNLRVQLDFELKAKIQKAIYAERKAAPEREMNEIKQQVATQFDLPFVNDGIQIPDARIEYDLAREGERDMGQGSQSGHADIEVLTAAYRPGHLRNKAQAGFQLYASASDRATLTAKIEGEHHLLDNILEL